MKPAGLENGVGIVSASYPKDPDDPTWKDDVGVKNWNVFMDKYVPNGDKHNYLYVYGYSAAQTMVQVLKQAGDDLTRENIMKQAENLKDVPLELLLPGITLNTGANDHFPIKQMQMQKFDGERWERFGPIIQGEVTLN